MRVLITGALGMIGSSLAQRLLTAGHNVIGIDYLRPAAQIPCKPENIYYKNFRHNFLAKQENFAYVDLNLSAIETPEGETGFQQFMKTLPYCDVVVHLAAVANVSLSQQYPRLVIGSNTTSTAAALEIAAINKAKFIFASSSSVYGNNSFSREDVPPTPLGAYAQSKVLGEELCQYYQKKYHLNILCARFFTAFGRYNRPDMFTHKILESLYEGKELTLFNQGNNMRSFIYVEDITQILTYIIENQVFYGLDILNIGSASCISTLELVEMFEKVSGKKTNKILSDIKNSFEPEFLECNNQKLISDFAPTFTEFPEAVEATISAYLESLHKLPSLQTSLELEDEY